MGPHAVALEGLSLGGGWRTRSQQHGLPCGSSFPRRCPGDPCLECEPSFWRQAGGESPGHSEQLHLVLVQVREYPSSTCRVAWRKSSLWLPTLLASPALPSRQPPPRRWAVAPVVRLKPSCPPPHPFLSLELSVLFSSLVLCHPGGSCLLTASLGMVSSGRARGASGVAGWSASLRLTLPGHIFDILFLLCIFKTLYDWLNLQKRIPLH